MVIKAGLPKFIQRRSLDLVMFSWVHCLRTNLPTLSIEKALLNYRDFFKLPDTDFDIESKKIEYYRMAEELKQAYSTV